MIIIFVCQPLWNVAMPCLSWSFGVSGKEAPVQPRLNRNQQSLQLLESMAPPAAFIRPVWLLGSRTLRRLGLSWVMRQVAASFLLSFFLWRNLGKGDLSLPICQVADWWGGRLLPKCWRGRIFSGKMRIGGKAPTFQDLWRTWTDSLVI